MQSKTGIKDKSNIIKFKRPAKPKCASCGDPNIIWLVFISDGKKAKWCEECAYQLRIRIKGNYKDHMERL